MASFMYVLSTRVLDITDDLRDNAKDRGITVPAVLCGIAAIVAMFLGRYLHSGFYITAVFMAFASGKFARTTFEDEARAYADGAYDVGKCQHKTEDECDCADIDCECSRCKTAASSGAAWSDDPRCTCDDVHTSICGLSSKA
jgi:hypothetical protein